MTMRNLFCLFGMLFLAFLFTDASAQKISDYKWLEGRYTNDAEANVENMGFYRADVVQKGRDQYEYYWNGDDKFCLAMVSHLGRIDRVFKGTRVDCNQKPDAGGAIAVGAVAAAILGSALLTSKSNDRNKHNINEENAEHVAAFDRGYRDGLYNKVHQNVYRGTADRNAYNKGYEEGVTQHIQETSHHSSHAESHGHGYVGDIYGQSASRGERLLVSRGFHKMNTTSNNWGTHEYWYNYDTDQCYDFTISNGVFNKVRNAQTYDCQEHLSTYNNAKTTSAYKKKHFIGDWDATGNMRCEINFRGNECEFAIKRHGLNSADFYIELPNGSERVFNFGGDRISTPGGGLSVKIGSNGNYLLSVGNEKYSIPQDIIFGD